MHASAWVSARDARRDDLSISPARCARARAVELGTGTCFLSSFSREIQNARNVVSSGVGARDTSRVWNSIRARLGRISPKS